MAVLEANKSFFAMKMALKTSNSQTSTVGSSAWVTF